MLIDTHCHLSDQSFDLDLDLVIKRALANDVQRMITISTCLSEFDRIIAIVEKYDEVFCSVGIHPLNISKDIYLKIESLLKFTDHPKVIALGETGLDYHYKSFFDYDQKKNFVAHIIAAQESDLPLIIHTRNADVDMEELLLREFEKKSFAFVMHSYSSSMHLAERILELGGYFSFSGILTFKNALDVRNIVMNLPEDRILIETDAPYLSPVPYRGKRNEPSFLYQTAECLAQILDRTHADISSITTRNAFNFFKKMPLELDQ
ncbi:MAG: TatD DNase family protein [Candidatus Tokpelaia sp. JSC161]|jgi:TatD DNase family protein|nr:MAG: TatD DNase family protein [Candidatus Tokpelaia sp. JSC161]